MRVMADTFLFQPLLPLFLLLLLLLLLPWPLNGYLLVDEVRDTLGAEEGRYFSIETSRTLVIAMVSEDGDADMYASTTHKNPSFENSEFASTSCGLDLLVVPAVSAGTRWKVHVGVYGHVRYATTTYVLYIIEPEEADLRRYQVWDWDPESDRVQLLIDVDPLVLANDPQLNLMLEGIAGLKAGRPQGKTEYVGGVKTVIEWVGYILLEILKIAVEVLA